MYRAVGGQSFNEIRWIQLIFINKYLPPQCLNETQGCARGILAFKQRPKPVVHIISS